MNADVVIVGGGIIGCATAIHLLRAEPTLRVTVVEPDPGYRLAATPRASGGIRQLFSLPENIALSQYTLDVIAHWTDFAGPDAPELLWRPNGYLFIAAERDAPRLATALDTQIRHGVRAEWLEPSELATRFPVLNVRDLAGGVFSADDGWLDPWAMLQGMLNAAQRLGARLVKDRVAGLTMQGTVVRTADLVSGGRLAADAFVNAAGCWAPDLAAGVGMPVPVEPMRRLEHQVHSPADMSGLPFVKDVHGLAIRPQGGGLSVGLVDFDHAGGFDLDVDHGHFDRAVWPALAHRIPALDQLRLKATTAGLYDQNRLDGNMIIGNHPGTVDNLHLACGFSGHGLMHAPGVGRALSELVLYGEFRTIDLSRFTYHRVVNHTPYAETGIR
ncbi:NAD(P)/FAD-dependent oxidoreductase [Actinocrispum wychmicini]|uniref:Glycine/D-amino acid oxidase-like deaminating enzyme n=1 Tax=Actinocrispum wychmicini TaxID=1213861 RepID=A0A4R2JZR7_9PSEU|nr:FAD-dependent oxidoreductase [Actinocrispum wychmicini]TCO62809.1 glycine/D-amino acid oxidase-like deaminating enzyme [Actinocrispum wychmicini]